jgi:hypothetical protein
LRQKKFTTNKTKISLKIVTAGDRYRVGIKAIEDSSKNKK